MEDWSKDEGQVFCELSKRVDSKEGSGTKDPKHKCAGASILGSSKGKGTVFKQ